MKKINLKKIEKYRNYLYNDERSEATIRKYMHDIMTFYYYLPNDKMFSKETLVLYKKYLLEKYQTTSVNSMLVALNGLLEFMNISELKLKLCKIQRKVFYDENKELTKAEYKRLLMIAKSKHNERLYMLIQTICTTGIRVSEHKYITMEALQDGKAIVRNKGKERIIFISKELKKLLMKYCSKANIKKGPIFITKNGKTLDRSNIWSEMKKLCVEAKVDAQKVFPHNLRHLFALTYYRLQKDIVRLADILGHASVETTRIYTMSNGKDCQRSLSRMELVVNLN